MPALKAPRNLLHLEMSGDRLTRIVSVGKFPLRICLPKNRSSEAESSFLPPSGASNSNFRVARSEALRRAWRVTQNHALRRLREMTASARMRRNSGPGSPLADRQTKVYQPRGSASPRRSVGYVVNLHQPVAFRSHSQPFTSNIANLSENTTLAAEQTDALVLKVFPWSETSCIANVYTRDFGKLSVLAKGARRPKSPFEAALDLLSICRVVFIPKSGDALDLLTEAKLVRRFRAGAADLLRLYSGYYVAELLDRLTDKGDEQPELFELAESTLLALANPELELRAIVLRLELQMLRMVGHLPSWRMCAQCGDDVPIDGNATFGLLASGVLCERCRSGARHMIQLPAQVRQTLEQFSESDWRMIPLTIYPNTNRAALRSVVKQYLTILLDRKLNLHSYLEELGR